MVIIITKLLSFVEKIVYTQDFQVIFVVKKLISQNMSMIMT